MQKNNNLIQDHEWHQLPNFDKSEFTCQCGCGKNYMDKNFMHSLQALRSKLKTPFDISSGYRCSNHSVEMKKSTLGTHTLGKACDIRVANGGQLFDICRYAIGGFSGIGISRKSGGGFIHLDTATVADGKVRPNVWSY